MSRPQVQLWPLAMMAALLGLIVNISAPAQDPGGSPPKSDSKTDVKSEDGTKADSKAKAKGDSEAVTKTSQDWLRVTDQEWQKMLTRGQYRVTRLKDTEQPFSGQYVANHAPGTYLCVCCKAELFSSRAKFDSGTGWPSFWQPVDVRAIAQAADYSEAEPRMEVMCRRCGAHLGHIFDDGPDPTGLRFCINSLALDFKAANGAAASGKTRAKAKVKAKAKTTKSKAAAPRKALPKDSDATPGEGEPSTPR